MFWNQWWWSSACKEFHKSKKLADSSTKINSKLDPFFLPLLLCSLQQTQFFLLLLCFSSTNLILLLLLCFLQQTQFFLLRGFLQLHCDWSNENLIERSFCLFIDYIEIHGIKDDDDDDEIIEPTNVFADTAKHTDARMRACTAQTVTAMSSQKF